MEIEAIQQCDVIVGGQPKALFPGQRYDLEEGAVAELLLSGKVRAFSPRVVESAVEVEAPVKVKAVSRPRARKVKP